jgi:hypothetical protein
LEAKGIFGQQARFAVETDIVAVVRDGQAGHLDRARRPAQGILKLSLKIDVGGSIAGGVGIGNVGGPQLLAGAEQIHVPFELSGDGVEHAALLEAHAWPLWKYNGIN